MYIDNEIPLTLVTSRNDLKAGADIAHYRVLVFES